MRTSSQEARLRQRAQRYAEQKTSAESLLNCGKPVWERNRLTFRVKQSFEITYRNRPLRVLIVSSSRRFITLNSTVQWGRLKDNPVIEFIRR